MQAFECFLCTRVKYQFQKGSGIKADREENSSQQENSLQRSSVIPGRFLTPNPGKGEIFQLVRKSRVMPSQFSLNTLRARNSIPFSFIHFPAKYEPFLVRNCINFSKLLLLPGWLSMKPEGRERNLMKYKLREGTKHLAPVVILRNAFFTILIFLSDVSNIQRHLLRYVQVLPIHCRK